MASRFKVARALLVALGAVAVLWVAAPTGCATQKNSCNLNSDCSNAYCLQGQCAEACVDSFLDCPKGYICNQIAQCEESDTGSSGAQGGSGSTSSTSSAQGSGGAS